VHFNTEAKRLLTWATTENTCYSRLLFTFGVLFLK